MPHVVKGYTYKTTKGKVIRVKGYLRAIKLKRRRTIKTGWERHQGT
jgi:hypothetical protein